MNRGNIKGLGYDFQAFTILCYASAFMRPSKVIRPMMSE